MFNTYKKWRIGNLLQARSDILLEMVIANESGNQETFDIEESKLKKIEQKLHKLGWLEIDSI